MLMTSEEYMAARRGLGRLLSERRSMIQGLIDAGNKDQQGVSEVRGDTIDSGSNI